MTPKLKIKIKAALIVACIVLFVAFIVGLLASCSAPKPKFKSVAKSEGPPMPPDPCPECPKCTNCWEPPTWNPIDTNGIWLSAGEVIDTPGETPPVHFVVWAHNLTNGVTYRWERAQENLQDWIPLNSFTATTNTASRTNGLPNPSRPYFFRLQWEQP